jgi:predicted outer membrane repeat protein
MAAREGSTATLSYVTFSGNSAEIGGGFDNIQSIATFTNVMFSGNSATLYGGGVYNVSLATFTNVTFSDNSAKYGGGLMNGAGDATLRNITFSRNSAKSLGGGIYNQGVVMLTNVTLNSNSAMPGAGGGIHNNGLDNYATLKNTILAGDPASSNCVNENDAAFLSTGFNISDDSSCVTYFTQPSDHSNLYPLLGPLADNGGFTMTHLPAPNSPVIDKGQCLEQIPSDQRGVARPQGPACDIGAVEVEVQVNFPLYLPMVVN